MFLACLLKLSGKDEFILQNSPPHNLLAAQSQILSIIVGGWWKLTISNLHFPSAFAAALDNSETGKQRKVTAVILGSVLTLCAL